LHTEKHEAKTLTISERKEERITSPVGFEGKDKRVMMNRFLVSSDAAGSPTYRKMFCSKFFEFLE